MRAKTSSTAMRRAVLAASGAALGLGGLVLWARQRRGKDETFSSRQAAPLATPYDVMIPGARDSDLIPDVTLWTQSGRPVRLYSDLIRDSRILLSFMYVRCQGVCPLTCALFQRLRRPVWERLGPNVKFLSITLDAEYDRPEVLQKYARRYHAQDERRPRQGEAPWYFLTGDPKVIEFTRRALGHYDPDPVIDADRTQHAALFTFGNDVTNRWATMPVGLPFDQTMAAIMRFLGTSFAQRYGTLPRPG